MISNFEEALRQCKTFPPQKMVVVSAGDRDVLEAVIHAKSAGVIEPILIDSKQKILEAAGNDLSIENIQIIDIDDKLSQCKMGMDLIREKRATILMKGLISTPILFKEVLNKDYGIRKGKLLSHVGVIKSEKYHKLLLMTDGGIVTDATLENKIEILKNALQVTKALGIDIAKAAIISAIETLTPNIQSTLDAAIITRMTDRKQIPGLIADGPLALDNAVSKESCKHKGIQSEIAGDVDILLMPNIESGNVFYKALMYLGGGKTESAGLVIGAEVPIVVPSRADTPESKFNSILISNLISHLRK
jgi:phosphate butyryltransferase